MTIKKLKIARKRIDKLDNNIFNLIKKRTQIVKYMLQHRYCSIIDIVATRNSYVVTPIFVLI